MNAPEPFQSKRALHRVLGLIVDSAMAADDALERDDLDALGEATRALAENTAFILRLSAFFRGS